MSKEILTIVKNIKKYGAKPDPRIETVKKIADDLMR
jgi:hypothetical protein